MLELIDGRDQGAPVHIPRPRPVSTGGTDPLDAVQEIVNAVRLRGDEALLEYTQLFDHVSLAPEAVKVPDENITKARSLVPPGLIDALDVMAERLRTTHERQMPESWLDERGDETIGEVVRPLHRVGVYVPGGRAAYPSSVLMAAIPARVAGVEGLAVASPPGRDGEVPEAILAACAVAGVTEVYRIGGAQAIAALAYGTATVRPVEKIVGPGNIYVTLAKRLVQGWVGVDLEAGPTEIAIVADGTADPEVVAADLIAQAEHGPLGAHVLITWEEGLATSVMSALEQQLLQHPRGDDVENALIEGGKAVLVRDRRQALEAADAFACEHLQLMFENAHDHLDEISNAGAILIGPWSPVPAGDYVAGTNHVLPSGGTARYSSGLSTRDFVKTIYVAELSETSLRRLAPHIESIAEAEGLLGHGRAVRRRLEPGAGP
jgi:histidinol dehydrogenase